MECGKRGFVYAGDKLDTLLKTRPHWLWTWSAQPPPGDLGGRPFVPCKWGGGEKSQLSGAWPIVFGYNEPDAAAQSRLSPEAAAALWARQVAPFGRLVGSPQCAKNPLKVGSWLRAFLAAGGSFDVLVVHRYSGPNADKFLAWLDALHAEFGKPVIVSEFAVARWEGGGGPHPLEAVKRFMVEACAGMEARPHVLRYAWKTRCVEDAVMGTSAIFDGQGELTELGALYASLP